MTEAEKEAITRIALSGLSFETIIRSYQTVIPNSVAIALIRGIFAGFMRDTLDALESDNLKTLAKYWMLASEGADAVRDNPTEEQIRAFEVFKTHVKKILGEEEVIWPDFDKI